MFILKLGRATVFNFINVENDLFWFSNNSKVFFFWILEKTRKQAVWVKTKTKKNKYNGQEPALHDKKLLKSVSIG